MLLPTDSRDKIGSGLAYPLGAEQISDAVADIPQAAQVSIRFQAQTTARASHFQQILRDGTPYVIVQCSLEWDGENFSGKSSNISWHIVVRPVLREIKATAREALLADGLPKLRDFLLRTATGEGRRQGIFFALSWSPDEKRVF